MNKIDKDGDGSVTEKELEDWIRNVSKRWDRATHASETYDSIWRLWYPACRYVLADAESRFGHYDKDNDGFIAPDEYTTAMFGSVEGNDYF